MLRRILVYALILVAGYYGYTWYSAQMADLEHRREAALEQSRDPLDPNWKSPTQKAATHPDAATETKAQPEASNTR